MKKHELLKHAYDNYPKGTKFLNLGASERTLCESNGVFYADKFGVKDSETHYFIFGSGKWAEIVTEEPKRVPLLTSEDGVDLYEGDEYYRAEIFQGKWNLSDYTNNYIINDLKPSHAVVHSPEMSRAFSTKESALKWIDEQKPKEIVLFKDDEVSAVVTKHKVKFNPTNPDLLNKWDGFIVSANELEQIYKAYKELS